MSHVLSWAGRVQDGPRTLFQKAGNGDFLICLFYLAQSFSQFIFDFRDLDIFTDYKPVTF